MSEPRTKRGRAYYEKFLQAEEDHDGLDDKDEPRCSGFGLDCAETLFAILAIEAEASAGAAPLAESLGHALYDLGVDDLPLDQALELAGRIIARLTGGADR